MKRALLPALLGALALGAPARAQAPADCAPALALVLSGGGAKGFGHIGVLHVLDSLRIRPDLIVGTSMGALVGALYASGMSARDIEVLVRESPLERLFRLERTGAVPRLGQVLQPVESMDPLLIWERRARSLQFRSPAVREDAVNALLTNSLLEGNLRAGGDFDRLPIPFRALATDLRNRGAVVLGRGDLARAVRASIAIPGVFTPVQLDSVPLVDGGFTHNVPIRPARALGAGRLIVSDVIDRPGEEVKTGSALAVIEQVFNLMMHEAADSLGPADIEIRPPTTGVGILDFTPGAAARLIEGGRRAAAEQLGRTTALTGNGCRTAPPGPTPDDTLLLLLRARLRAIAAFRPRAVWLNPRHVDDSLALAPVAELAAAGRMAAGLGYDNQRGGHAWASTDDFGVLRERVRLGGVVYLGELRRLALLRITGPGLRRLAPGRQDRESLPDPRTGRPPWAGRPGMSIRPGAAFHLATEDLRQYDGSGRLRETVPFRDILAYAGAELESDRGWYGLIGPVVQWWSGEDTLWSAPPSGRQAIGAIGRIAWTVGPPPGIEGLAPVDGLTLEGLWTTRYQRALVTASAPARIGTVELRARGLAGWGHRLPPGETFSLGGPEGFPGLKYGERRGDRVATVALEGTRWIQGPIYGRIELAAGSIARGGTVLPARRWAVGASAGVLVNTAVGSVSVATGTNSYGRNALLVRVGGR